MTRLFTIAIVFALLALSAIAQKPQPILLENRDKSDCESNVEGLDNFYIELVGDPNAHGYLVLSGPDEKLLSLLDLDMHFDSAMRFCRFDATRITTVRENKPGKVHYQFWVVPTGAAPPKFDAIPSSYFLSPSINRFLLHSDIEEICSTSTFPRFYAEVLTSNSGFEGHVVIYGDKKNRFRELREAKRALLGIPPRRLRYFFSKKVVNFPYAEYWIVVNKK